PHAADDAYHRTSRDGRRAIRAAGRRKPAVCGRLAVTTHRYRHGRGRADPVAGRRHAGAGSSPAVIQLFRIRGIPVRIDAGWLVIFALVTWSLAAGYFPHVLPARPSATYWLQAVLAAVLLFASVFL